MGVRTPMPLMGVIENVDNDGGWVDLSQMLLSQPSSRE